ncbi:MAG: rhamnose transport system substrate-binding protein, partial [Subtercola sp.]|nr:rhamnose transport system substrate-binding protein [Subtercola sp.]
MISKKKVIAVGAIALAAVLTVSGCTSRTDSSSGGSTSSAGASDAKVTVAFVPKLQGIPYFEAMNAGGKKAAEELG